MPHEEFQWEGILLGKLKRELELSSTISETATKISASIPKFQKNKIIFDNILENPHF